MIIINMLACWWNGISWLSQCWVLVNINCHLSWKWMDKWLPALVINPLVWGLFFCELQLASHNCWFFLTVFVTLIFVIGLLRGVYLAVFRCVFVQKCLVREERGEDIPMADYSQGRSDQTEQQTQRQLVTPTSLLFVVCGGSSVECLTSCEYWWKLSITMIWQCVPKMLILSVRNTHQWLLSIFYL